MLVRACVYVRAFGCVWLCVYVFVCAYVWQFFVCVAGCGHGCVWGLAEARKVI